MKVLATEVLLGDFVPFVGTLSLFIYKLLQIKRLAALVAPYVSAHGPCRRTDYMIPLNVSSSTREQ